MGVWRDMPVEALEQQYSPSRWSPRLDSEAVIQAHLEATAAGTQRARAGAQTSLHVPYGDGDREKLDIYFPAEPAGAFPALVYIHGGYWQCLSKDESGFAAPPLVSQGVAVVALGYDIAPKGHMDAMVLQVRRSLAFLVRRYSRIRGLYLCGHSAGAHLAAMVLATDWTEYGVVPDIKGAVLVSGVYDLEPILHTYVNDALNMSRKPEPQALATPTPPGRLVRTAEDAGVRGLSLRCLLQGGGPEEQPHALHPLSSAHVLRGTCGCGPARLPRVPQAVAGVWPGPACCRLVRLPAGSRGRGSL
ncbi:kynurenine formamidase isoform X4 [Larus michahellis]|uniref:kynurenine formamidase isoform X4 n=1 Tax=Larus michahellis TaxID=119627 RepID=UPI003D9B1708